MNIERMQPADFDAVYRLLTQSFPATERRGAAGQRALFSDSAYRVDILRAPDGGRVFVEIKKKYDGVVYKRRITASPADAAAFLRTGQSAQLLGQIGREIAWFQHTYHAGPKVFLAYDRAAFSGADDPAVRITFDTGIRWRTTALDLRRGDYGAPLLPPEQILMELKLPGACPLWLSRALTDIDARPTSFSKYGACYKTHILPNESFTKEALCSA